MNKNVLLIFPSFGFQLWTPTRPPLGVLTVAAPLVEKGFQLTILDERVEVDFDKLLLAELKKEPVCVGISSMSGRHIKQALRISKMVKDNSSIPVVWGGVQASLSPETTIEHKLIDIIVRDDGEETFPLLLDALNNKQHDFDQIPGIAYKKNGNVIFTEEPVAADIEKLPRIPLELIDYEKYQLHPDSIEYRWCTQPRKIIPLETSRGCPFRCIFCTESVRKKKWRALSPERVVDDIEYYVKKYGIHNFTFIDDNLFGNVRRGEKIVDLLIKRDLNINWYTNLRTDYMSRASSGFVKKLEKAGCKMLTFGAESGSERILKMISKEANQEHVIKTNRNLKGSNIISHFVAIRGFPTETKEEVIETYNLLCQLLLENKKATCDSPLLIATPSTIIAEMCLGDRIKNYKLEDWAEIFDIFKDEKPPWVLKETYDFIESHPSFEPLFLQASRSSKTVRSVLRQVLRLYQFAIKYGFSSQLDMLLQLSRKIIKRIIAQLN